MSSGVEHDSEFVRRAAAELTAARPAYRDLIGFYADIFAAQEDARLRVRLEPFTLASDRVRIKLKDGFPLIQVTEMRYDTDATAALLKDLCRIAVDRQSELAGSAELLLKHATEISPLFAGFLHDDASRVTHAAEAMGVDVKALSFFLYHSLRPSICRCEQELCGYLADATAWEKGYCPVCGSLPALAWLEGEGQRFLHCSFCWHRWAVPRALCPFCASRDPQALSYFYSEDEKDYRVDVCNACRKYVKTVDTRNLARGCYPPLEQIASLHLDVKAAEAGFEAGLAISLPV
jgi:FdhE protein